MTAERHELLLQILRRSTGPVPGPELAAELQVSTRSVRQYVRALNNRTGEELVRTSHRGYQLNLNAYKRLRVRMSSRHRREDSPQHRLYLLARHLVTHQEGTPLFRLVEELSVSIDTVESDLARARVLLRAHDLTMRRERDVLTVHGSERSKRRLVRQTLLDSAAGLSPASLQAFELDYPSLDLRVLRERVRHALDASGTDVNEYALADILIHLAIATDRVQHGHVIGPDEATICESPDVLVLVSRLADAVQDTAGVVLPPEERRFLSGVLALRGLPRPLLAPGSPAASSEITAAVRETMRVVSDHYLLELGDETNTASLALHVQALIARAMARQSLRSPLGPAFRTLHPVIYELALLFASRIERTMGITVDEGEVDFLAFHLGGLFHRQLDQGPLLSITCVVPGYHHTHEDVASRLRTAVAGQAVVEAVVTELDHDWSKVASDVIVSVVDLPAAPTAPIVLISPFLTLGDIDHVRAVVASERRRTLAQKLRSDVLTVIEPQLFHHLRRTATKESVLKLMCERMVETGAADHGFLDDVLDRERRSSTAFGEHFAVPHSLYLDAPRTAVSVLVNDEPIPWGDASVRLVLLFAVSADQRRLFREVLDQLIAVLGQPACVDALLKGGTHDAFVRTLDQMLEH